MTFLVKAFYCMRLGLESDSSHYICDLWLDLDLQRNDLRLDLDLHRNDLRLDLDFQGNDLLPTQVKSRATQGPHKFLK